MWLAYSLIIAAGWLEMLKRQHTEGGLDEGEMDLKRSRGEDGQGMALVAVPTEESQQLIIAEKNNKVSELCIMRICLGNIGHSMGAFK